jgi:hypothetical protein
LSLPGFAFATATSSFSVLAGTFGCTVSIIGEVATNATPLKSFTGSNGSL